MPTDDFGFALELTGKPPTPDMLSELVRSVLDRVGCANDQVPAILASLQNAIDQAVGQSNGRSKLEFAVLDGMLSVVVSSSAGTVWQTSLPIA